MSEGLSAQEHARQAEWLMGAIGSSWYCSTDEDLVRAQVHATLAVARAAIEARQSMLVEAPEIRPAVPR
jgi:hypothetical protein